MFKVNPNARISKLLEKCFLIEDFFENIEEVKKVAYAQPYQHEHDAYQKIDKSNILIEDPDLHNFLLKVIQPDKKLKCISDFHFHCSLKRDQDFGHPAIHVDNFLIDKDKDYWFLIGYMNDLVVKDAGSIFWKNNETGTTNLEELFLHDIMAGKNSNIFVNNGKDFDNWTPHLRLDYRANNAILANSTYFHSASPGFGDNLKNGRLVFIGYFEVQY